jgi:hypothetical protein
MSRSEIQMPHRDSLQGSEIPAHGNRLSGLPPESAEGLPIDAKLLDERCRYWPACSKRTHQARMAGVGPNTAHARPKYKASPCKSGNNVAPSGAEMHTSSSGLPRSPNVAFPPEAGQKRNLFAASQSPAGRVTRGRFA